MQSTIIHRAAARYRRMRGFTMIEIMVVVTIAAILLVVGLPAMSEFVADQRVRTVASDIAGEIALARAKSIETSRRVYISKLDGVFWKNGWRLYADMNDNAIYDNGTDIELKRFDGFTSGTIYVCTLPIGAFLLQIPFRPDGHIPRAGVIQPTDGIYVVDTMGDGDPTNDKIRGVRFGLSGRATVVKLNGTGVPCPAN